LKDERMGHGVRPLELIPKAVGPCWCSGFRREPLDRLLGAPMEVERFLRLAIGIAVASGKLHQRGLVHKDIKPSISW